MAVEESEGVSHGCELWQKGSNFGGKEREIKEGESENLGVATNLGLYWDRVEREIYPRSIKIQNDRWQVFIGCPGFYRAETNFYLCE